MATDYMTTDEVATMIHLSPSTLRAWRSKKMGPPTLHAGRRVLYRRSDVNTWVEHSGDMFVL
jgi:excisionase family DNA binding protein